MSLKACASVRVRENTASGFLHRTRVGTNVLLFFAFIWPLATYRSTFGSSHADCGSMCSDSKFCIPFAFMVLCLAIRVSEVRILLFFVSEWRACPLVLTRSTSIVIVFFLSLGAKAAMDSYCPMCHAMCWVCPVWFSTAITVKGCSAFWKPRRSQVI